MTRPATQDEIADRGRDLLKHDFWVLDPEQVKALFGRQCHIEPNATAQFVTPLSPSSVRLGPLVYPDPLQDPPPETPAPASSED